MTKIIGLLISCIFVINIVASISVVSAVGSPVIEKRLFIHYKKGFGKPEGTPGNGPPPKDGGDDGYFDILGKGVFWKTTPVQYVVDPDNSGFTGDLLQAFSRASEEWDSHTDTELFSTLIVVDHASSWDDEVPDGRNELVFGDYPQSGVIAVTIVWGYFSGPPAMRGIIEFDIMFDTDFTWGDASTSSQSVMDLQNIATHEFGHAVGLGDLYQDAADQETMYGYASYDETLKRDLYAGDIAGIQTLYG